MNIFILTFHKYDKAFASDLYLIYNRSPAARVCKSDTDRLLMLYLVLIIWQSSRVKCSILIGSWNIPRTYVGCSRDQYADYTTQPHDQNKTKIARAFLRFIIRSIILIIINLIISIYYRLWHTSFPLYATTIPSGILRMIPKTSLVHPIIINSYIWCSYILFCIALYCNDVRPCFILIMRLPLSLLLFVNCKHIVCLQVQCLVLTVSV